MHAFANKSNNVEHASVVNILNLYHLKTDNKPFSYFNIAGHILFYICTCMCDKQWLISVGRAKVTEDRKLDLTFCSSTNNDNHEIHSITLTTCLIKIPEKMFRLSFHSHSLIISLNSEMWYKWELTSTHAKRSRVPADVQGGCSDAL